MFVLGSLGAAQAAPAQAQRAFGPPNAEFWVGAAALVVGTAAFDADISSAASGNHHTTLNRLANSLEPAGAQRYDLPALAGAWVIARVVGPRPGAAVLRIAAGYVAADLLESVLKPAVGRHRPDMTDGAPWRFRPFGGGGAWQSFPSGHTTHVFSIAAGIAEEVRSPVVKVAAYGVASLVGWQRIESRAHWPSDVALSAVLATVAGTTTNRWLRRDRSHPPSQGRVRVFVSPTLFMVSVATGS